ncbi:hypothetical protein GOODEAATRI_000813 [Goodea atripinnis]|uniref:Uncharacterized protein n=1 Tax=Goodea atripinnis TaxID=208336 RepID=A0ABV0NA28_9TELE
MKDHRKGAERERQREPGERERGGLGRVDAYETCGRCTTSHRGSTSEGRKKERISCRSERPQRPREVKHPHEYFQCRDPPNTGQPLTFYVRLLVGRCLSLLSPENMLKLLLF